MAALQFDTFGTKDPDDVLPKNFDWAARLIKLGNPTVANWSVDVIGGVTLPIGELTAGDEALVISAVGYSAELKRVSFVWAGGTPGKWYLLRCRLTFANGWSKDYSATVQIADH